MSTIVIHRESKDVLRYSLYKIWIDGQCVDKIGDGERLFIKVNPGNHQIYVSVDWCRSKKVNFNINESEIIKMECGTNINIFNIIFFLTIAYFRYLYITII